MMAEARNMRGVSLPRNAGEGMSGWEGSVRP
jgi:hypothetical protein